MVLERSLYVKQKKLFLAACGSTSRLYKPWLKFVLGIQRQTAVPHPFNRRFREEYMSPSSTLILSSQAIKHWFRSSSFSPVSSSSSSHWSCPSAHKHLNGLLLEWLTWVCGVCGVWFFFFLQISLYESLKY